MNKTLLALVLTLASTSALACERDDHECQDRENRLYQMEQEQEHQREQMAEQQRQYERQQREQERMEQNRQERNAPSMDSGPGAADLVNCYSRGDCN